MAGYKSVGKREGIPHGVDSEKINGRALLLDPPVKKNY
jgi:hypothetical protein